MITLFFAVDISILLDLHILRLDLLFWDLKIEASVEIM